jgi:hypothetical protein
MQTYGFLRIYDAKVGSISTLTSRLDAAMCFAWFGAAVVLSPSRMTKILSDYYEAGGAAVPRSAIETVTAVWVLVTAIVTVLFLGHLVRNWTRGAAPNPVKLALMTGSFAFWWYSNVVVTNLLVGIALFEVFHDVQYLAIVWTFNLNRVRRTANVGGFTRFLFRRSGALVGMYVGLVAAYGSLNVVQRMLPSDVLRQVATGMLAASALLHFYYDGFIWKVRESSTRESLGLDAARRPIEPVPSAGWVHGLKWAPFVLAVFWLASSEMRGTLPPVERYRLIAAAVPESADAQNNLGVALLMQGDAETGEKHLWEALRLKLRRSALQGGSGVGSTGSEGRCRSALSRGAAARPAADPDVLQSGQRPDGPGQDHRGDRSLPGRAANRPLRFAGAHQPRGLSPSTG